MEIEIVLEATTAGENLTTSQTVAYTGFDKVSKVKQGVDSICYSYGYDLQRTFMEEHVGSTVRTKRYVGNCEYITETNASNTDTQWLTYLSGPTGVYAVVLTKSGSDQIFYILKDNLGSWTAITNETGVLKRELSYDAWGNLRNPDSWATYTVADLFDKPVFNRGFTGHEHLYNFGLINMNGRMYDPMMSSFLSADRFVQNPTTAQGFNRYAYCMNNPLRYVDPTGWLAGGGVGTYGEHPLWVPYYVNDMITIDLPEVTILADNPSLSNTYEYEEFEYTPNITSGGFDNGWGNTSGWSSDRHLRGSGGGNGNHGGGKAVKSMLGENLKGWMKYKQENYLPLIEYWQKQNPALFWDKNGDGKLQKNEADDWWLNAKGEDIYVNNALIDWSGLQIPDGLTIGDFFAIGTTDAFLLLPWETASTYGGTSFIIVDTSIVEVVDQEYHYDMRGWNTTENIMRNIATIIGRPGINGTDYMIHYYNPKINVKK